MKIKKIIAIVLCFVCIVSCFTGCSKQEMVYHQLVSKCEKSGGQFTVNGNILTYTDKDNIRFLMYTSPITEKIFGNIGFMDNFSSCMVLVDDIKFNIDMDVYGGGTFGIEQISPGNFDETKVGMLVLSLFLSFFKDFKLNPSDIGLKGWDLDLY